MTCLLGVHDSSTTPPTMHLLGTSPAAVMEDIVSMTYSNSGPGLNPVLLYILRIRLWPAFPGVRSIGRGGRGCLRISYIMLVSCHTGPQCIRIYLDCYKRVFSAVNAPCVDFVRTSRCRPGLSLVVAGSPKTRSNYPR